MIYNEDLRSAVHIKQSDISMSDLSQANNKQQMDNVIIDCKKASEMRLMLTLHKAQRLDCPYYLTGEMSESVCVQRYYF